MRFVKPLWLNHKGDKKDFEVYSCHVSPDGKRLVTAAGDGHVRIWSTEAILKASDPTYTDPTQLCAMSYHSGTIHSVRFSPNNVYLASGADDKIVCIYTLDPKPPAHTTFEKPPAENWRIFRRLIGHDNDVQDIGWSYDATILVSVGLDSKIVVWSGFTFEKLKTISVHQSHVKGITFDPANKYFATASDDRSLKIFRFTSPDAKSTPYDQANNFVLEHNITEPFSHSPLTTYFRRLDWSPEGLCIAAANAVNGPVSSVAIVHRGTWTTDVSLIGHEGPIEVCAFSPRMFYTKPVEEASLNKSDVASTVLACAGQDKTLSVWITHVSRPLVITHELASKTITDLAWAPDGETLYATSLDGTIVAIVFEPTELGFAAPVAKIDQELAVYGGSRRTGIVENPDALRLEESSKADELKGVQGRMGELMGDAAQNSPLPKVNGTTIVTNGTPAVTAETASEVPANKDAREMSEQPPVPATNVAKTNGDTTSAVTQDLQAARLDKLKQRVTITKDGKKRIAPLLLSSSAGLSESSLPKTQLLASASQGVKAVAPQTVIDVSKPYEGLPKGGLASLLLGNKRKFAEIEGDDEHRVEKRLQAIQRTGATPIVRNTPDGVLPPVLAGKPTNEIAEPLRPAIISPSLTVSQVRLAVPLVRGAIKRPLDSDSVHDSGATTTDDDPKDDSGIIFEARNSTGPARTGRPQDRQPTRIHVLRRGQLIWQDFLPRACLLVAGNWNFWTAACEDGSLYVWTPAGRRLLNAIILEAQPVILDVRGWWLLCITAVGTCHVWNLKTISSPHPPVSLAPVLDSAAVAQQSHLTASPSIMFARLNSAGRIIVGTSNGEGYMYAPDLYTWLRLSEPWWAVGSQYWNTMDTSISSVAGGTNSNGRDAKSADADSVGPSDLSSAIIPMLERNTTTQALLKGRVYFLQRLVKTLLSAEGYEGFESAVSIAHLENRIAAALALAARDEFRIYLIMYAKRLGSDGLKSKVSELLKTLYGNNETDAEGEDQGTTGSGVVGQGWYGDGEEIVGWKRIDLLKEVLLILGKYRDLQRITVPYARLLGVVNQPGTTASSDGDGLVNGASDGDAVMAD